MWNQTIGFLGKNSPTGGIFLPPLISTDFDKLPLYGRLLKISLHKKKIIQIRSPCDELELIKNPLSDPKI